MKYDSNYKLNLVDRLDRMPELSQEVTWRSLATGEGTEQERLEIEREIITQWKGIGHYFRIDDPKMSVMRNEHGEEIIHPSGKQVDQVRIKCDECGEKYGDGNVTFVYLAAERSENESYVVPYRTFHILRSKRRHKDISDEIKKLERILEGLPL